MKIFVFGNSLVKEDAVALQILPRLKKKFPEIDFEAVDPNENFPPIGVLDLTIIDVVKGIQSIILLNASDLVSIEKSPVSPHDYDLLLHLLLLKKMGKINEVKIIGIPYGVYVKTAFHDITTIISTLLSRNGKRKTCKDQKRE